jgi:uroporphyrinogen-III synthase
MYHVITRSLNYAEDYNSTLQKANIKTFIEPLFTINTCWAEQSNLSKSLTTANLLIATSKNAITALAEMATIRDIPLIAVGHGSAQLAQELGFLKVSNGGGDVVQLIRYVASNYASGSRILYLRGDIISLDLKAKLLAYGFKAEELILYNTIYSKQFSDAMLELLKAQKIGSASFFSAKSAQVFIQHLRSAKLENCLRGSYAFALSQTIKKELQRIEWAKFFVANFPNQESLERKVIAVLSKE